LSDSPFAQSPEANTPESKVAAPKAFQSDFQNPYVILCYNRLAIATDGDELTPMFRFKWFSILPI